MTKPVTIVSGLPRAGTSMLMAMLEAGGMELLTDGIRAADTDNPRGYFEFEPVKRLEKDSSWLPQARGRVVKVVSPLLHCLPESEHYRILFVRRDLREVLASQMEMLRRRGESVTSDDGRIEASFRRHLQRVESWIEDRPRTHALFVEHRDVLQSAVATATRIRDFLDHPLDVERMAAVVDPGLHRQRA